MCKLLPTFCGAEPERAPFCVDFNLLGGKRGRLDAIHLNINLYPEYLQTPLGHVRVTVRRCRLELDIEAGEMPLEHRGLRAALKTKVMKARKLATGTKDAKTSSGGSALTASAGHEGTGAKVESTASNTTTSEGSFLLEDAFTVQDWQFVSGGSATSPAWDLEEKEKQGELLGGLDREFLGLLRRNGTLCRIQARMRAFPRDLSIKGQSGLLPDDMNASNRVVRHLLILGYLGKRVRPWLHCRCFEVQ